MLDKREIEKWLNHIYYPADFGGANYPGIANEIKNSNGVQVLEFIMALERKLNSQQFVDTLNLIHAEI